MLTIAQQKYIRTCCIDKGESINSVAKRTGHHWSTIKKYIDKSDFNEANVERRQRVTKLDKVKPVIDIWLMEDKKAKPKQRHTAKRIYERLCAEYKDDFDASYRTVRNYVSVRKKEIYKGNSSFLPLSHPAGEAQADFGEVEFIEKGIRQAGFYLSLSFPYSNAGYVQLFKGQNLECLLSGLRTIFEYMGSVPDTIWFDNLTPVVKGMGKGGRRILSKSFEAFALHYGFKHNFCSPGKGHEKGSVENKVGYYRRNFFVPIPRFEDMDVFNKELLIVADKDMQRPHYKKGKDIWELFKTDKTVMLPLPEVPYEIYRLEKVKANGYGKATIDAKYTYSAAPEYAHKRVWLKITHDKVHILDGNYKEIVIHNRLYGENYEAMNWVPYLDLLSKRPNALRYTEFYNKLPEPIKDYFKHCSYEETRAGIRVLSKLIKTLGSEKALAVFHEMMDKELSHEEGGSALLEKREGG